MMKFAILAVVAFAGLALAKENIYEKEGNLYRHGERTGVFKNAPFVDLYKQYAVAFVTPKIVPKIDDQDLRNYRPSFDVCRDFFQVFVIEGHKIYDFDQFVVLDACLGYVLDGVYNEPDENVPEDTKRDFEKLAQKPEIVSLYKTAMNSFPAKEKTCVADLLIRSILARKQYPEVVCNNHMIQIYLQFAECQRDANEEHQANGEEKHLSYDSQDPYVKTLYSLLRERVDVCVNEEVASIENAVRHRFANKRHFPHRMAKFLGREQLAQQSQYMWPNEIVKILAVVQDSDKQIDLRQVHQIVSSYTRDDEKMKNIFLNHLAKYATRKIKPSREGNNISPKSPAYNDNTGLKRYEALVNDLCNPFRVSSSEKHYNFALSIIRLAQLLQHPNMFNVTVDSFLDKVLQRTREVGPVYLSIYSCNLMSYTQGTYSKTEVGKPQYKVAFKPDISKMVVWPLAKYI